MYYIHEALQLCLPLSIHVRVAASGVAELSPTPTPLSTAIVASVPVIEEQNACHGKYGTSIEHQLMSTCQHCANTVSIPVLCPIFDTRGSRH